MTRRPLCLAALLICAAIFLSLYLFPQDILSFEEFDGNTALVSGIVSSMNYRAAWDGSTVLRLTLTDLEWQEPEKLGLRMPRDASVVCDTSPEAEKETFPGGEGPCGRQDPGVRRSLQSGRL